MTDIVNFNSDSFSHGQIVSKLWLCQQLEPFLHDVKNIAILGCWYNILGFMLKVRGYDFNITGYDIDSTALVVSDRVCDTWCLDGSIKHLVADVNEINLDDFDLVINTSSEHMSSQWFDRIRSGAIVCVQSSDIDDPKWPWLVCNPSDSLKTFCNRYQLSQQLFVGSKSFDYGYLVYDRFMIIGVK